jgi:hypothetical protein
MQKKRGSDIPYKILKIPDSFLSLMQLYSYRNKYYANTHLLKKRVLNILSKYSLQTP